MLGSVSRWIPKCTYPFLPLGHRPTPPSSHGSAFQQNIPPSGFLTGKILGTVIIPYVQASSFARHPDCSRRNNPASLFFRSRGQAAGSVLWAWTVFRVAHHVIRSSGGDGFSIRAERCVVTFTRIGYASRLNRAIDDRGLSPHQTCSHVGCSTCSFPASGEPSESLL